MDQSITHWKFLHGDGETIYSDADHSQWSIGQWRRQGGPIYCCSNGFHCSATPLDALYYVAGTVVAQVEVRGESDTDENKSAHEEMRIVRAWRWTGRDSVALALYAARLVLPLYEQVYPADDRLKRAAAQVDNFVEGCEADLDTARVDAQQACYDAARDDNSLAQSVACALRHAIAAAIYTQELPERPIKAVARALDALYDAKHAARMSVPATGDDEADDEAGNARSAAVKQSVNDWLAAYISTLTPITQKHTPEESGA